MDLDGSVRLTNNRKRFCDVVMVTCSASMGQNDDNGNCVFSFPRWVRDEEAIYLTTRMLAQSHRGMRTVLRIV